MFARKTLAGAVTVAVTGSALALTAGVAQAAYVQDADDTTFTPVTADVIGAGSDTSQHALKLLADSWNATVPAGGAKLATYAATSGGTLDLPTSTTLTRPNGSGAGKKTLYGAGNNVDIDFARSSNSVADTGNEAEIAAGLQQFPFALDTLKLAVSGNVTSHAPATISAADMVKIYDGTFDDWSDLPGGTAGVIEPKIPQAGSGTRSFFVNQLKAANGGVTVALASTVKDVQEHDPAAIQDNANAVAPFSEGRAGLLGTKLTLTGGFTADRALYNVVRGTDLGNESIQALFGVNGFLCSDDAIDEIEAAGFKQLDVPADGGECGKATQATVTNFKLNEPVEPVATVTKVTGSSPAARALRVVARVTGGTSAPTGTVVFIDSATDAVLGTKALIGGAATLDLTGRAPKSYSITASYTPEEETPFVASSGTGTVKVKAASSIKETFASVVKKGVKKAKGVVTVAFGSTSVKPTGTVVVKKGAKTVGTGKLAGGKVTLNLLKAKVGAGKSTLKITYGGDANGFGSSKSFTITFKK